MSRALDISSRSGVVTKAESGKRKAKSNAVRIFPLFAFRLSLLLFWLAAFTIGCAVRREPVPLDPPSDTPAVAAEPEPELVEIEEVGRIEEEPLVDETVVSPGVIGPDGALPVDEPALEDTITASTAPNVAAATRMVVAARERMGAGDYGAALEQLERAIAIDSTNSYAYYYLAEVHLVHHTYDQAIEFADRAASLSAARAPDWASRAYTLQGNAFEAAGRFVDARRAYTSAIQAAPGNLAAQVGLTRVGSGGGAQP